MPIRLGPAGLRPLQPGVHIAGRVCPARHAGSTDVFLEAIAAAARGDVLVIDNSGRLDEGCIGDLVAGEAHVAGLAGIVVWGAHRDTRRDSGDRHPRLVAGHVSGGAAGSPHPQPACARSCVVQPRHRHERRCDFCRRGRHCRRGRADLARVVDAARDIAAREQAQAARLRQGRAVARPAPAGGLRRAPHADPAHTFRDAPRVARRRYRDLTGFRRQASGARPQAPGARSQAQAPGFQAPDPASDRDSWLFVPSSRDPEA